MAIDDIEAVGAVDTVSPAREQASAVTEQASGGGGGADGQAPKKDGGRQGGAQKPPAAGPEAPKAKGTGDSLREEALMVQYQQEMEQAEIAFGRVRKVDPRTMDKQDQARELKEAYEAGLPPPERVKPDTED